MGAGEERRKQGERGTIQWIQALMWGAFLSAVMFGLGFLAGSHWGEKRAAEARPPPVSRLMPPPMEVLPSGRDDSSASEGDAGGRVWGILTGQEETVSHEDFPSPPPESQEAPVAAVPLTTQDTALSSKASVFYTVQVGASRDPQRAEALVRELKDKGYPSPRVLKVEIPGQGTWYRIRLGAFQRKAEAEQWAEKIRQQERVSPRVMVEKSQSP